MSGGVISQDDFNLLQEQLIDLKRFKYEASEREKKLQSELKSQKEHIETLENESQKKKSNFSLSGIMSQKNKVSELTEENESLKKSIQQTQQDHQLQSEALKHNIKSLFETNKELEDELLLLKKDMQQYVIKVEDQQSTNRKLQVEIAELICSKEELENKVESLASNGGGASNSPGLVGADVESNSLKQSNLLNLLDEEFWNNEDKEEIKNQIRLKINEIYDSTNEKSNDEEQQPQQQQQPKKQVIFHPLGEPVYNAEEEKEKAKLRETIKSLMEQIKEVELKSSRQQSESKEYQQTIETLNATIKEWQEKTRAAEINRVKIEEKLEGEIKKLNSDIATLNQEKEDIIIKRADLEQTISILNETIKKEQENSNSLEKQLKDQKFHYETKVSDSNDQSNIFKMARDEYAQTLKTVSDDLAIKDKLIENKGEEIQHLKETIVNLEQELEKRTNDLKESSANQESMSSQIKKVDEKLSRERNSFDSLTERFNKLNSEFGDSEKQCKQLQKQLDETKDQLQQTEQAKAELELNSSILGEKIAQFELDLKERNEKISELEITVEDNNKRLIEFDELNQTYNEAREKNEELESSNANLQLTLSQYEKCKEDLDEATAKVSKLEVALADAETEKKIAEKKTNKMIKDLKSELSKERTSVNLLTQSGNSIPTTPSSSPLMSQSANSISLPTTPIQTPSRSHMRTMSQGIPLSASSPSSPSPKILTPNITMNPKHRSEPSLDSLKVDIEVMGKKLGELGTEKYKLEEKIRQLEENVLLLNQDIEKKNKVVRFYISKTQLGKATSQDEKSKRLKGGALGSFWRNNDPHLVGEMVEKMETMLQEYILKNIQLSDDVDVLGNEASRLSTENRAIKQLLQENNISLPSAETK